jgi:hypothetical protein
MQPIYALPGEFSEVMTMARYRNLLMAGAIPNRLCVPMPFIFEIRPNGKPKTCPKTLLDNLSQPAKIRSI